MVVSLADGVWWLDLPQANAYLVDDDGALTLVDTGGPRHADRLRAAIEVVDDPAAVDRILITHYDVDHVGGLGRVDGLRAPIYAGTADAPLVAGDEKPALTSRKGILQRVFGVFCRPPDGPVRAVDDGDHVGGFTVVHTPGHNEGHVVYLHEARSLALLGDLVVGSNGGFKPPHRHSNADTAETYRSIRRLAEGSWGFEIGAPGHGRPITDAASAKLRACASSLE